MAELWLDSLEALAAAGSTDAGRAASAALADPEAALFASTPALDIRSHEQAFLRTRLFQS